jgi:hypothetical protein
LARKDVLNPDGSLTLTQRTQEILTFAFDNPTLTQKAIAQHFGVRESYISRMMNSDRVLAAYPLLAKRRMKSMVPKAMKRFDELMNQKDNPEVARKVSERVLLEQKVLANDEININFTLKELPDTELAAKLRGFGAVGPTIDATIVPPLVEHHLDKEVSSDGDSASTPKNTPNDAP